MSVKDYNKVIILSDTITGNIITQIPYEDKTIAYEYISNIIYEQLINEKGILIKIGIRT